MDILKTITCDIWSNGNTTLFLLKRPRRRDNILRAVVLYNLQPLHRFDPDDAYLLGDALAANSNLAVDHFYSALHSGSEWQASTARLILQKQPDLRASEDWIRLQQLELEHGNKLQSMLAFDRYSISTPRELQEARKKVKKPLGNHELLQHAAALCMPGSAEGKQSSWEDASCFRNRIRADITAEVSSGLYEFHRQNPGPIRKLPSPIRREYEKKVKQLRRQAVAERDPARHSTCSRFEYIDACLNEGMPKNDIDYEEGDEKIYAKLRRKYKEDMEWKFISKHSAYNPAALLKRLG